MNPILVFDIETMPDLITGKQIYDIEAGLSDDDAMTALIALREAETDGSSFMRLPLHKIACLSFLWVEGEKFVLKSLSLETMTERDILATFLRAFEKKPTIVSWNGAAFDLPVLLYRLTHHKLSAAPITRAGTQKADYLNRYSDKHIDLMDKFSFGIWNNKQKLDTVAGLCGFAGKGGVDGSQVVPMIQAGRWHDLSVYCERDVLNTWVLYLRWQLLMGLLSAEQVETYSQQTKGFLESLLNHDGHRRHHEFLAGWRD